MLKIITPLFLVFLSMSSPYLQAQQAQDQTNNMKLTLVFKDKIEQGNGQSIEKAINWVDVRIDITLEDDRTLVDYNRTDIDGKVDVILPADVNASRVVVKTDVNAQSDVCVKGQTLVYDSGDPEFNKDNAGNTTALPSKTGTLEFRYTISVKPPKVNITDINFASGSSVLPNNSQTTTALEQITTFLTDNQRDYPCSKFEIQGHTDSDGADANNQTLSEKRAKAVLDYVAAHSSNLNLNMIVSAGYGERNLIKVNNVENKAKSRRVTITAKEWVRWTASPTNTVISSSNVGDKKITLYLDPYNKITNATKIEGSGWDPSARLNSSDPKNITLAVGSDKYKVNFPTGNYRTYELFKAVESVCDTDLNQKLTLYTDDNMAIHSADKLAGWESNDNITKVTPPDSVVVSKIKESGKEYPLTFSSDRKKFFYPESDDKVIICKNEADNAQTLKITVDKNDSAMAIKSFTLGDKWNNNDSKLTANGDVVTVLRGTDIVALNIAKNRETFSFSPEKVQEKAEKVKTSTCETDPTKIIVITFTKDDFDKWVMNSAKKPEVSPTANGIQPAGGWALNEDVSLDPKSGSVMAPNPNKGGQLEPVKFSADYSTFSFSPAEAPLQNNNFDITSVNKLVPGQTLTITIDKTDPNKAMKNVQLDKGWDAGCKISSYGDNFVTVTKNGTPIVLTVDLDRLKFAAPAAEQQQQHNVDAEAKLLDETIAIAGTIKSADDCDAISELLEKLALFQNVKGPGGITIGGSEIDFDAGKISLVCSYDKFKGFAREGAWQGLHQAVMDASNKCSKRATKKTPLLKAKVGLSYKLDYAYMDSIKGEQIVNALEVTVKDYSLPSCTKPGSKWDVSFLPFDATVDIKIDKGIHIDQAYLQAYLTRLSIDTGYVYWLLDAIGFNYQQMCDGVTLTAVDLVGTKFGGKIDGDGNLENVVIQFNASYSYGGATNDKRILVQGQSVPLERLDKDKNGKIKTDFFGAQACNAGLGLTFNMKAYNKKKNYYTPISLTLSGDLRYFADKGKSFLPTNLDYDKPIRLFDANWNTNNFGCDINAEVNVELVPKFNLAFGVGLMSQSHYLEYNRHVTTAPYSTVVYDPRTQDPTITDYPETQSNDAAKVSDFTNRLTANIGITLNW